jgi:hypothetical protein
VRVRESADRPHLWDVGLPACAGIDAAVQSAGLQSAGPRSQDPVQPRQMHLHLVQEELSIANTSCCVLGSSQPLLWRRGRAWTCEVWPLRRSAFATAIQGWLHESAAREVLRRMNVLKFTNATSIAMRLAIDDPFDRTFIEMSTVLTNKVSHCECMRVAPLVRVTLGSIKRSSPRLRSCSELSALGRYGPWRSPEWCVSRCATLTHRY